MENIGLYILGSSISLLALLIIIALMYYIISNRGLKRQKKIMEELHRDLKRGQTVVCVGGLFGKLVRVGDETCDIEVKSGAVIEISRFAISSIVK